MGDQLAMKESVAAREDLETSVCERDSNQMGRLDIYPSSHTKTLPYMVHNSIDMRFSLRQRTYLVTTLCSNGLYLGQANMARLSSNGPVGGAAASCCDKQDFTDNF